MIHYHKVHRQHCQSKQNVIRVPRSCVADDHFIGLNSTFILKLNLFPFFFLILPTPLFRLVALVLGTK